MIRNLFLDIFRDLSHQSSARREARVHWFVRLGRACAGVCGAVVWGALVLLGCSGDTTGDAALVAPSDQFWQLQLNYPAVNLALAPSYDTVRLAATPLDAAGHVMTNLGRVQFHAADSTVTVDSAGLVTAHFQASVNSPTYVTAALTVNGVTHWDTALVQVTSSAPAAPLATFSMQPVNGDSAKDAFGDGRSAPLLAQDNANGVLRDNVNGVNNLLVKFTSSDPRVASIDSRSGSFFPVVVGPVTFYATTYAYGVFKQDSLAYTIGYPIISGLNHQFICGVTVGGGWQLAFVSPDTLRIGIGGEASLGHTSFCQSKNRRPDADTLKVVFDEPGAVTDVSDGGTRSADGDTVYITDPSAVITLVPQLGVFHWHIDDFGGAHGIIKTYP